MTIRTKARYSDLMRALGVTRQALRQQVGNSSGDDSGGWRTWRRADVGRLALERALITAGLPVEAARTITTSVLPDGAITAAEAPAGWLAITVKPDQWVWNNVPIRRLDMGTEPPQHPWPVILLHPQTVIGEALARLDADDASFEPVVMRQPTVRPAVRSDAEVWTR